MNSFVRKNARRMGAIAAAAEMAIGGISLAQAASAAGLSPLVLEAGQTLPAGQSVVSTSGQYQLIMQTDGNLVEYGNGIPMWSTRTEGNPGATFTLQTDGNAVVYSTTRKALWNSKTAGTSQAQGKVIVGGDGQLEILGNSSALRWENGNPPTNSLAAGAALSTGWYLQAGRDELIMQSDGNLVQYVGTKAVWSSRTNGHPGSYAILQSDGNLVIYNGFSESGAPEVVWNTRTAGTHANRLTVGDNTLTLTKGTAVLWKEP